MTQNNNLIAVNNTLFSKENPYNENNFLEFYDNGILLCNLTDFSDNSLNSLQLEEKESKELYLKMKNYFEKEEEK